MDRAHLHAWLTTQIDERLPPAELAAGFGQQIQELARALAAFERGGGTAFGMHVTEQDGDLEPFARKLRATLRAWRDRLGESHGADGTAAVSSIIARCNVVLDPAPLPTASGPARAAVDRFVKVLGDRALLARAWRAAGDLDDGELELEVEVEVGDPEVDRLAQLVQIAREAFALELPASYIELLRTCNGVSVRAADAPVVPEVVRVPARQLAEPTIWPAEVQGDHFQLLDVVLDGIEHPFVFGGLVDAGTLALDAAGACPVYWIPQEIAYSDPTPLAPSFDEFLEVFGEHALRVPGLLRAARVRGWGA